jgi:hypothetical protein
VHRHEETTGSKFGSRSSEAKEISVAQNYLAEGKGNETSVAQTYHRT